MRGIAAHDANAGQPRGKDRRGSLRKPVRPSADRATTGIDLAVIEPPAEAESLFEGYKLESGPSLTTLLRALAAGAAARCVCFAGAARHPCSSLQSELERLRATLSSYLGHFRRANAFQLWQSLWRSHAWLGVYFDWDATRQRLVPRHAIPKGLTTVRQQYAWVCGRFPGDVALFQVGAYCELYDRRDAPIAEALGLKPLTENRRGGRYGIPQRLFGRHLARLLGAGRSVVVVRQGERQWSRIRERLLAWRMVPAGV